MVMNKIWIKPELTVINISATTLGDGAQNFVDGSDGLCNGTGDPGNAACS